MLVLFFALQESSIIEQHQLIAYQHQPGSAQGATVEEVTANEPPDSSATMTPPATNPPTFPDSPLIALCKVNHSTCNPHPINNLLCYYHLSQTHHNFVTVLSFVSYLRP